MTRKHATRGYQLRAGYTGNTYQAPLHINSRGLRGPEREVSLSSDALRVVVLGDSMVYGVGVADDETAPALLEGLLQSRHAGPVQVFNLGVPSYNTEDELLYLRESYDTYKPDLVILQYMYDNDSLFKPRPIPQVGWRHFALWQSLREIPPSSWAVHWIMRLVSRAQFALSTPPPPTDRHERLRAHTAEMLRTAYADDAPGWIEVQDAMKGIADFCHAHHVGLAMGIYLDDGDLDARSREIIEPAVDKIASAARARGIDHVLVLDAAWPDFAGHEAALWVTPYDMHWSPVAHQRVAALLSDYLSLHPELIER